MCGRGPRSGIGKIGAGRARWFLGGVLRPRIDRAEIARRTQGLPEIVRGVVEGSAPEAIGRARVAHAFPMAQWRKGSSCSAIEDAAQLAEALDAATSVESGLDRYAERRKGQDRGD